MTVPKPLVDDIVDGRCLPFVGSGFSVNAVLPDGRRMPTWPGLTSALAQSAGASPDLAGPEVASLFEKRFGRVQLIEQIRKALYVDQSSPGPAHITFGRLPFDTVYTTNFDTLLEDTYRLLRLPYRALVGERQMPFHGGRTMASIVKMHGDVRHEEYITITREDYAAYLNRYPVIATHLSAMLITRTPLFLGYSLTDPNFISIQEIVKSRLGDLVRMSYVIQFNTPEDEVNKLLDKGIHVISLHAESDEARTEALTHFLESILRACDINSVQNLRSAEPGLFEPVDPVNIQQALSSGNSAAVLSGSSHFALVLMPFGSVSNTVFREAVSPAIDSFGLIPVTVDQLDSAQSRILETVRTGVQQARLCIADISDGNPNVTFEVGLAVSFRKPLLLIARKDAALPIDFIDRHILRYEPEDLDSLQDRLRSAIESLLGTDLMDEARELIATGHYRAAIAVLGSLLEQTLWSRYRFLHPNETKEARKNRSLRALVDALATEQALPQQLYNDLVEAISTRNRAVHTGTTLSAEEANFMFDRVRDVLQLSPPTAPVLY
jgi:hypothetical protein